MRDFFSATKFLISFSVMIAATLSVSAADSIVPWRVGFSRVDVTPSEPVRMAGYGNRDHPSEAVDTPLYVRCMALKSEKNDDVSLLISVDTIGMRGEMTSELAAEIQDNFAVPRERIVFTSTHTHCGPVLANELPNIFEVPLNDEEKAAGGPYKQKLNRGIIAAVGQAMRNFKDAKLSYGVGQANFAANRRVLTNGRWTGFGVQADGPVDHSVPILRITDASDALLGVVFNYACHCTTLGGEYYNINAEWAGYATTKIEAEHPGAFAICTIGCGADANPEPRGTVDIAKLHGRTMATEVERVIGSDMFKIDHPMECRFDYAALAFELPSKAELQQRLSDPNVQTKRHAEQLLQVIREEGRLPATQPVPIQSWQFGDQLTMVFLGGEVVVDYAIRLKQTLDIEHLWVTAYANDVLGYIASEKMRAEGGYEYNRSGVLYGLPGPWAAGTEDLLVQRVVELLRERGRPKPLSLQESIKSFVLPDDYELRLVASEPLIVDPINMAFDSLGRLWVVEMSDYPEGKAGGVIKTLSDSDGDGVFDRATEFLSDLSFPTGVFPWKDGVLISSAPDILFARDIDGDGVADEVETLYTGFRLANPQHRINGFSYGLDHSLHLASGDNLGLLKSVKTGEEIDASGHDVQIWPESGRLAATSGRSQYVRSRNEWGEWFGSDNSRPMFHFPIADEKLKRNSAVVFKASSQQMFSPPVAPPVYPITSSSERFNDLFAANRFTSACSAIVACSPHFFVDDKQQKRQSVFVCEPVHNLVHRSALILDGATYRCERVEQEQSTEFLRSRDPWFRPVRAMIGPEGDLYIVDMYRETIEHPEWIPQAWQATLNLRAGSDRGRIYRISARDAYVPTQMPLDSLSSIELVEQLRSPVGTRRDMAHQLIIERADDSATEMLSAMAIDQSNPEAQVHALSILDIQNRLTTSLLSESLTTNHPGVLLVAIELAASRLPSESSLLEQLDKCGKHPDLRVVKQTALALGQTEDPEAASILAGMILSDRIDFWTAAAISSSLKHHAPTILDELIPKLSAGAHSVPISTQLLTDLIATSANDGADVLDDFGPLFSDSQTDIANQIRLAASLTKALDSRRREQFSALLRPVYSRAIDCVGDSVADEKLRCESLSLVGIGIGSSADEKSLLLDLLTPKTPLAIQRQALDRMAQFTDAQTCGEIIDQWPSMSEPVRQHAINGMLGRKSWAKELVTALRSNKIKLVDLSPSARQQLMQSDPQSMQVFADSATSGKASLDKQTLVKDYLTRMQSDKEALPDIERGAILFRQQCAACHSSTVDRAAVGANLSNLTDRRTETLITAILDPNRAVDPKYQTFVVQLNDDRVLLGFIEEEVGSSLTIAHADGNRSTIRRQAIDQVKATGLSLMPEGLEAVISPDSMRDLIGYLQSEPESKQTIQ